MSDTVLSTRWVVYYGAENRQKRVYRDTSVTPTVTDSVNALYSALQDLFDELNQMDDGVPMSAQTPTEYTIGIIDAGDADPWFIDRTSVEYLTGGSLKTASWTRSEGSNTGIIKVTCSNTSIVAGDIGEDITGDADSDSGTLLDVKGTGAGSTLWIRPDSSAAANSFDNSSQALTCNSHAATQSAAPDSGESLWSNIYTLGTIEPNTHLYVYQNNAYLTEYKDSTQDWWGDGHIDVLINVKEVDTEIDEGYITVLARQYSKTYSYYIVDLTNGGRNPIPLQTGDDLNNETGYRQFTGSSGSGTFTVGNYIYWTDSGGYSWSTTTKKGVITAVGGTAGAPILTYYLIGEPISDFANGNTVIQEYTGTGDGDASCTAGTPSDVGPPALSTLPTATFGGLATGGSYDIDENGTAENYSIVIDCNSNALTDVYEWAKYITRRGNTSDIDAGSQTIVGESYIGSEYRLRYSGSVSGGTIDDGDTVTQATSGATGIVVNHNTTDKIIILRNSRGTFSTSYTVTSGGGSGTITPDSEASAVTPIAAAPFGTFAGGKFFCAPGVVLDDYLTADTNNYQLVDDNGTVRVAPTKVNITVGNTRAGDKIAVFRLTGSGGTIQKNTYQATVHAIGDATLVVGSSIATDEPGKTTGGVVRLVDVTANQEYRLRFSSWTGTTFTLANIVPAALTTGTDSTHLVSTTDELDAAQVGDLVLNTSQSNAVSYVTDVSAGTNTLTISPAISGQSSSDTVEINAIPVITTTSDTVYVPFIDVYETTGTDGSPGSETVQVVYSSTVYTRVRARNAGNILPFEQDSSITSTGMTVSVIRTADTIYT